jgi:hypothetical protein
VGIITDFLAERPSISLAGVGSHSIALVARLKARKINMPAHETMARLLVMVGI